MKRQDTLSVLEKRRINNFVSPILLCAVLIFAVWSRELWSRLPLLLSSPQLYGTSTLNIIKRRAYFSDRVNWSQIWAQNRIASDSAVSPSDMHVVIRDTISQLQDRHSLLLAPGPVGTIRLKLASSETRNIPTSQIREGIGIIRLPSTNQDRLSDGRSYSKLLRSLTITTAQTVCGIVIDLRGNTGGNVIPMLTGIAPLLGNGIIAGYQYRSGLMIPILQFQGIVMNGPLPTGYLVTRSTERKLSKIPAAVLIGTSTASSGELVAVAFQNRPKTRFFGEPSFGASSNRLNIRLADGARLFIADAVFRDRAGHLYGDKLKPDEPISEFYVPTADNDDVVLASALRWLARQTGC